MLLFLCLLACSSPDSATVTQPPASPSMLNKTPKKVPAVWKGFVMMQSVAKFGTSAYRVSGSCDDLLQLLPDTLHVQGRIAHEQVWDYLLQLKSSTSRVWNINYSLSQRHTWRFYTPIAANLIASENRKPFSTPIDTDTPGDFSHRSRRCGTSTLFM